MESLVVGDKVLAAAGDSYSDVYMFSHRLAATQSLFTRIATDGGHRILLTADHYLYVNGTLAIAGSVRMGDTLSTRNGSSTRVVAVDTVWERGLYNPHTMDGDIVVNGILTSTYTRAVAPALAHAALWPVRMLHRLGHDIVGGAFDAGSELVTALMPDGKPRY